MNAHLSPEQLFESMFEQLSSNMQSMAGVTHRPIEERVMALQLNFQKHAFISGTFTSKVTIWGFPELIFVGTVCGKNIAHHVWC